MVPTTTGTTTTPTVFAPLRLICETSRHLPKAVQQPKETVSRHLPIFPLRNGIDFLGFHSYLTETGAVIQKLRRESAQRMKAKIRHWERAYPAGEATKEEILCSFLAWDAHAAHGDTYALRRQYADRLEKLLDCKIPIHRKINSNKLARDRRRARQCRCIYKKQHKALSLSVSQNTRPAEIMPWA